GQQQRTAIARALINGASLILADEPTGNLDSKSSKQILELLKELNAEGHTILMVTHDPKMDEDCSKIFFLQDGNIVDVGVKKTISSGVVEHKGVSRNDDDDSDKRLARRLKLNKYLGFFKLLWPTAYLVWENLHRHKLRTFLTMMGITMGLAAIMAMVTLGQFTKRKILETYAELGVNTLAFYGQPSWKLQATDAVPVMFRAFDWEREVLPLKNIFPQIARMSPFLQDWRSKVVYGGKTVEGDSQMQGVNQDYLQITKRELLLGRNFTVNHELVNFTTPR
ncbi:MAG: ABC transporter permease, partial [Oligoflexia bacterium]|nr:ABC transporter permease [Oligoflexia bacterium]